MKNTSLNTGIIGLLLLLTIQISAQVTRQPYLQDLTSTSVVIRWQTGVLTPGKVFYGPSVTSLSKYKIEPKNGGIYHEVRVDSLMPDTRYYYSVSGASKGSEDQYFMTSPVPGTAKPTRIWVISDFGQTSSSQNENRMETVTQWKTFNNNNYHADFILSLGDQTQDDAIYQLQHNFFNQVEKVVKMSPLFTTIGNHDYHDSIYNYQRTFTLPVQGEAGGVPSGTKQYYSFDYANIHVVVLCTEIEDDAGYKIQTEWLKKDLENNRQEWLIACLHRPFHSGGHHKSDTDESMIKNRKNWLTLLEDHGVDLVLQGHNHVYERSFLIDNLIGQTTTYTVANNKSTTLGREDVDGAYKKNKNTPHQGTIFLTSWAGGVAQEDWVKYPIFAVAYSKNGLIGSEVIDINGDRMDVKSLSNVPDEKDSHIWDYFTIIKTK
jgi:acid phosphatase type 7